VVAGPPSGGGGNCPGPPGSGSPYKFFVGPQSFFWVKYFRAKGKIFVFFWACVVADNHTHKYSHVHTNPGETSWPQNRDWFCP
jgi:hypothetical protein